MVNHQFLILFLLLLWPSLSIGSGAASVCELNTNAIHKDETENLKKIVDALVNRPDPKTMNVGDFCTENLKKGMAAFIIQNHWEKDPDGKFQAALKSGNLERVTASPWTMSLYPNERVRLWNYEHNSIQYLYPGSFHPPSVNQALLLADDPTEIKKWPPSSKDLVKEYLDHAVSAPIKELKEHEFEKKYLCFRYAGFMHKDDCLRALKEIIEISSPRTDEYMLLPLIKKTTNDPIYGKVAIDVAKKVQTKIDKGGVPSGNIFDDIYASFISMGEKPESAKDKAFDLLALYSTHGPVTGRFLFRFINQKSVGLFYGLSAFTAGMMVLNSRSMSTGHPYAFPKEVKSTCDNGKPYHFWMPAYFGRELAKKVKDPEARRAAAFISELMYQIKRDDPSQGHDPTRPFTVDTFDAGNNKIRMDLAWAAAGSAYGVNSLNTSASLLDVDGSIRSLVKDAKIISPLKPEKAKEAWDGFWKSAESYDRWTDIFSPHSAYSSFEQ